MLELNDIATIFSSGSKQMSAIAITSTHITACEIRLPSVLEVIIFAIPFRLEHTDFCKSIRKRVKADNEDKAYCRFHKADSRAQAVLPLYQTNAVNICIDNVAGLIDKRIIQVINLIEPGT